MPDSSPPHDEAPAPDDAGTTPARWRTWGRRGAWAIGGTVGGLLLLLATLLVVLQTEWGATQAARWLAASVNPISNTEITIDRASGTWLHSLKLTGVTLTRTDSSTGAAVSMAQIDTVAARYRLLSLFRGRVHVTDATIDGPEGTMRQAADSTWDWVRMLPDSDPSDTSATMPIQIDRLRVEQGRFAAAFYAEGRDSTARVRALSLQGHDLQLTPSVAGRLDSLGLRARVPGDTTDLRLAARGGLSSTALTVDTLQLDSPRSRVRGHGRVHLPSAPGASVDDVSLQLRATPFALRDLTVFAPTLDVNPEETVRLDLSVTGSGQRLLGTLDARFSGGGTVTAEAAATPTTTTPVDGPPLQYRLDAQVDDLTTSLFGPPDSTQNRLNATLAVDLKGRSLSALGGTANLRVANTRWRTLRSPELTITSTMRDGAASVDLQGTLNGARTTITGTARPLDDTPSADLTAEVQNLDVSAFTPDSGIGSDLSATAELQARAVGTADERIEADVTLAPSRVGVQSLTGGRGRLILGPDRAEARVDVALPKGQIEVAGSAALNGTERFALETGRFKNVNVAALVGDSTKNQVTGTVQGEGRGYTPETMRLDATLTLRDSRYGPHQLSSLNTTAALDEGRLETTTDATVNGSDWALALAGRPFAPTPRIELTKGRFQDLDIGPFLQDTTQSSELHGRIQGTIQGTTLSTTQLEADLSLDSSRVNRQSIDEVSLDLRLQDGRLDTDFTLDTPEGGTAFTATARPFDAMPTYRITEGSFEHLNVGAFADLPALTTALSGSFTMSGRGATATALALDAGVSVRDSRINDASFPEGNLSLSTEEGEATVDGQFALAGGEVRMQGTVNSLAASPRYALQTTVGSLDAGALAGLDSLTARIDTLQWRLDGQGTDPSTLRASTHLSTARGQIDRLPLDAAELRGTLRRGQLALDTLVVQSEMFESRGSGLLAVTDPEAASNFSLRTTIRDADRLRQLVGAETFRLQSGVLETRIYGESIASQRFDGRASLEGLVYDDAQLAEAELHFNGRRGQEQLLQGLELDGTLGSVSVPSFSVRETRLQATYDGSTVDLSTNLQVDSTHTLDLGARIVPDADRTTATLSRLNVRMGPDRWSLLQDATLTVGDHYRIRNFLLRSEDQQIAADGTVDVQGTQSLAVTAEQIQLGPIAPLVGWSGLAGTASGSLDLTGPATAPQIEGELALNLQSRERAVGTLRLDTDYQDRALSLDARLTHTDGSILTAKGSVPIDLRLRAPTPANVKSRPVRLDLTTDQFPVNWIDPFLDPTTVRDVTGTLAADVAVRGTRDTPDLDGTVSLTGGGAYLPDLNIRYRNATATAQFADDQITLEKALVHTPNGGRLQAEGVINLPELTVGEYDLKLKAGDFLAIDTRAYSEGIMDGRLTLQGTTRRPELDGDVQVRSGVIHYQEALTEGTGDKRAVSLNKEDQLTLERRFGIRLSASDTTTFDAYDAMAMDLTVQIERNTWLRSKSTPEMNIQFTGDLDLTKKHNEEAQVFGSIEVLEERSTLRQFGQEFQITEGSLTFNGNPETPYLTLAAEYEQRAQGTQENEVLITLTLEGRPDNLSPTLSSEPPMDTRNILSYLATGRPADQLLSGSNGSNGSSNFATKFALGQATNFVENLAARELGLDVVRIQVDPTGSSFFTAGRYFTPRLFVSVKQPMAMSSGGNSQSSQVAPNLTLEYQLTDTLLLRSLNNENSLQFDLLFEYAY